MRRHILALVLAGTLITLAACGGKTPGGSVNVPGEGTSSSRPGNSAGDSSAVIPALTLNSTEIALNAAGATFQLRAATEPGYTPDPAEKVVYISSDPAVAAVAEDGAITAVAPGTASIHVEFCGGVASAVVTCDWKEEAASGGDFGSSVSEAALTLNKTDITLKSAGETFQLRCTITPDIYDGLAVYTSSDESAATVDLTGRITAVSPGKATITAQYDSWTASCIVRCRWEDSSAGDSGSSDSSSSSAGDKTTLAPPDTALDADLEAFYAAVAGEYEFGPLGLADDGLLDQFYPGLTGINTEQRLVYICQMLMNNGEFGLVQVKDGADVEAVKAVFQARVDYMVGDGNGPGGAWYPMAMNAWENNSRIVSNGNYIMMIVHEKADEIVEKFNVLF